MAININGKTYRELRCKNDSCRKLFGYEVVFAGRLLIICSRCGTHNEYVFKHLKNKENEDKINSEFTVNLPVNKNPKGGEK